jgi:hypothetical protein
VFDYDYGDDDDADDCDDDDDDDEKKNEDKCDPNLLSGSYWRLHTLTLAVSADQASVKRKT